MRQFLLSAILVMAAVFCSCNRQKPYQINGVLNIPSEIPYGDTIIQIPSPEGEWVYLVEGDEPIDSCQIIDNRFTFSGEISDKDAHFVQVISLFCSALVALEPGDISIYSDGMQTVTTGTTSNDAVNSLQLGLSQLETRMQDRFEAISDSLSQLDEEFGFEHYSTLAAEYSALQIQLLDSIYEANPDNLASIYAAVLRHGEDSSAEEFEQSMNEYPERVRNNEFVQSCIRAMRAQEQSMNGSYLDESMFADPEEAEESAE